MIAETVHYVSAGNKQPEGALMDEPERPPGCCAAIVVSEGDEKEADLFVMYPNGSVGRRIGVPYLERSKSKGEKTKSGEESWHPIH